MGSEKSRFTSDRRGPASSSWADDSDWAAGATEDVDLVDGRLVGRPPKQHSELPDGVVLRESNYSIEYRSEWDGGSDGITNYEWSGETAMFEGRKNNWNHGVIWFVTPSPIDITRYSELRFDFEITRIDAGPTQFGIYGSERYSELASADDVRVHPSYYPDGDVNNDVETSALRLNSTYDRQWMSLDLTQWHDEEAFNDGAYIGFGMNSGIGGSSSMDWMTCYMYDIELV